MVGHGDARIRLLLAASAVMVFCSCPKGTGVTDQGDAGGDAGIPDADVDTPKDKVQDGDLTGDAGTDDALPTGEDVTDSENAGDVADDGPQPPQKGFTHLDLSSVGNVRAMWASQEASIWAVGDSGLVLRFNGADFVPVGPPGVTANLYGIGGEGGTVVVVGASGTVLRRTAGAWSALPPPKDVDLHGVGVLGADDFYVVGKGGAIFRYKAGMWTDETTGITYDLYGAYASKVGGVYAVGRYGTLLELKGTAWVQSQITPPGTDLRSIWRAPDGKMVAVGTLGSVAVYDGILWKIDITNDTYDPPRDLFSVTGFSASEAFAVGDKGAILRYNGKKWTLMTIGGPYNVFEDFRAVAGVITPDGKKRVFAAGLGSKAVELEDKTWIDKSLGVNGDLNGVWVRPDGTVVAAGAHGLLLTFKEGHFGTMETGVETDLRSVSGNWVAGDAGTLLVLDGSEASAIETDTGEDLVDCWAVEGGAWVVGSTGTVLKATGSGVSGVGGLAGVPLTAVYAASDNDVWVAGSGGLVYRNDGQGFKKVTTGTFSAMRDLWGAPGSTIIAVGDNGIILECDGDSCQHAFEQPATFLYGVGGTSGGPVLAVGWAGTVLSMEKGAFTALDSGTARIFKAVAPGPGGVFALAGLDGTFTLYKP